MASNPIIKGFRTSSGEIGKVDYESLLNLPSIKDLTADDILNILSQNGESPVFFKDANGNLFISAKALIDAIDTDQLIQTGGLNPAKIQTSFGNNIYNTFDDFEQLDDSHIDSNLGRIVIDANAPVGSGKALSVHPSQIINLYISKREIGKITLEKNKNIKIDELKLIYFS